MRHYGTTNNIPAHQATPDRKPSEGTAAVPVGGGSAWPGFETTRHHTQHRRPRGGRRSVGTTNDTKPPGPCGAGRLTRQAARRPSAKGSAHLGAGGTQAHDHAAFLTHPPRGCGNTLTGTTRQRARARR